MNVRTLMMAAAAYAPRLFQISRKTWMLIGGAALLLVVLSAWALFASAQWLFHQGRDAANDIVNSAPSLSKAVIGQVESVAPGAKEKLAGVVEGLNLKQVSPREVSGSDVAPVERYAGFVRTAWDKSGVVQYEGKAEFQQVRDHYRKSFTGQDFIETSLSGSQEAEVHEYIKNDERYVVTTTQKTSSIVQVKIEKHSS